MDNIENRINEALFVNETELNKEINNALTRHLLRKIKPLLIVCAIIIILSGIGIIITGDYATGAVFIALPFVFAGTIIFANKLALKSNKILQSKPKNTYYFYKDCLEVDSVSPKFTGSSKMQYDCITMVSEDDKLIFMMINKAQAYVVLKDKFSKGNYIDFMVFLKSQNIPFKGKNYGK